MHFSSPLNASPPTHPPNQNVLLLNVDEILKVTEPCCSNLIHREFARRAPGACLARYLCMKYPISSPKSIPTEGSPPSRPH